MRGNDQRQTQREVEREKERERERERGGRKEIERCGSRWSDGGRKVEENPVYHVKSSKYMTL